MKAILNIKSYLELEIRKLKIEQDCAKQEVKK
jgi:hypothetical protein